MPVTPTFTRRHHETLASALAQALRDARAPAEPSLSQTAPRAGVWHAVYAVSDALARDNPRFDAARFLAAVQDRTTCASG